VDPPTVIDASQREEVCKVYGIVMGDQEEGARLAGVRRCVHGRDDVGARRYQL
jgi:hypothetical protein